jgi:hypothetical protein
MLRKTDRTLAGPSAALVMTLTGGLAASQSTAADWDFSPRISAGQSWTDNVTAAGKGEEESEWITSLTPGFNLGLKGPRADMSLDYEAQALWYKENSEFDDVFHSLLGTGQFGLVPNHFYLDAFARYDQENIDPSRRVTTGNLFRTGNRTDVAVYGLSPWYTTRFGRWAEALLRYRYFRVSYHDTDATSVNVQDSDSNSIFAQLGSPADKPGLSWNTRISYSSTDFEFAPTFEYGQAALELGVPVGLRSRLTATGGIESDVATDPTKGGFDKGFWYLGYLWEPSQLQTFEVRGGHRYYGTAWEMRWNRRGTRGELTVDYSEQPTTANQSLFDGEGTFSGGRPGTPRLEPNVYLRKRLSGRASYELVRTTLSARVYALRREREQPELTDDEVMGVALAADWNAAPRTRVTLATRYENRDFGAAIRGSDTYALSASVRRDLTQLLHARFTVSHHRRDFDIVEPGVLDDYRINAATLTIGAEF